MNLLPNSSEKDILDWLVTNLESQVESKFNFLKEQNDELDKAKRKVKDAKEEVSLLDKINIFSKSDTERERDKRKDIAERIDEKINAVNVDINDQIKNYLPDHIKTGCLFEDIKASIDLSNLSIDKSMEQCRRMDNINDSGTNGSNSNNHTFKNQYVGDLNKQLDATSNVLDDASNRLMELIDHLEKSNNINIVLYNEKDIVQKTYNLLAAKFIN